MTAKEFFLSTPLYTEVVFENLDQLDAVTSREAIEDFEGYNPLAQYETTFRMKSPLTNNRHPMSGYKSLDENGFDFIEFTMVCLRSEMEFKFFCHWQGFNMSLTKVGQWPSLAEFHLTQVKQYDKLIGKSDLKEFTRAIGLTAHGIGIGSFVYLRRVFEHLIYESVELKKQEGDFDEEAFRHMYMAERIDYLKNYLPEFLVEHSELYGILSKGIHELTEEECLTHFDVVKAGIEFILDEKLEKHTRRRKMEEASAKIKSTAGAVKK